MDFANLKLLAVFATVVESGSFAAAARTLNSSRSRISETVAQLEAALGVRLLQRSTRKLSLTQEGERVFAEARKLPQILHDTETAISPQIPSGRVTLTLGHDIAHNVLLPVLADFHCKYPQVKLDLLVDDNKRDLIAEQIDLAIRIGLPKDDALIGRVMHEERMIVIASPEYLARVGTPNSLQALAACEWISLKQTSADNVQRFLQHGKLVEISPKSYFRCNSPLMVQKMVHAGLGVGALLPTTVKNELKSGELVHIMPSLSSDPLVFSLMYPSRHQLPLRTKVVIDYLLSAKLFG